MGAGGAKEGGFRRGWFNDLMEDRSFWGSGRSRAAQTPKIDDFRSVKKSDINGGSWFDGESVILGVWAVPGGPETL